MRKPLRQWIALFDFKPNSQVLELSHLFPGAWQPSICWALFVQILISRKLTFPLIPFQMERLTLNRGMPMVLPDSLRNTWTLLSAHLLVLGLFFPQSLLAQSNSHDQKSNRVEVRGPSPSFQVEEIFSDKNVVWGFDFLDSNRIIYTLRSGELKILDLRSRSSEPIKEGVPQVWAQGQGGLLDVRVHPKTKELIYLTFSDPLDNKSMTAFGFGTLRENKLKNFRKVFSGKQPNSESIHFGSRIEFDGKGHVFITIGDRNDRKKVQDLGFHNGKVIRLKEDGTVPSDNPFASKKGAAPEIWSLGHRSPQGLALQPGTNQIWLAEMGPKGGDELNLIQKGLNYGWPVITYGHEYWGPTIGEGTHKEGLEQPVAYWAPSISPSGMAFYSGDVFPQWKGNLFLGCLGGSQLRRLVLSENKVTSQEILLSGKGYRIRNVRTGPDGFLYFSTDNGSISRIVPQ